MKSTVFFTAMLSLAASLPAQNVNRFTFHLGGGFTEPINPTGARLDRGFNLGAGAGVNIVPNLGMSVDFGYHQLGLNPGTLALAGVPGGGARVYSLTLNPMIRVNPHGRVDAYLTGGGGYYRRTVEFTQPTTIQVTGFDPFWGVFFPAEIPANQVIGSFSQNRGGFNVGAGVQFRVRGDSNAKFFAESKFHYIYTSPNRTSLLPVTFGFRW